jgi:TonB family protein
MKNVRQSGLSRLDLRLVVAGVISAFVVLFVASLTLSYILHRKQEPPAGAAAVPFAAAQTMDQWKIQLATLLERNKRFPDGATCERGTVQLAFRLDRQGAVVGSEVQTSSGIAAFDAEALDLVARIGRFPPPPNPAQDVLHFTVPIHFEGTNDACTPEADSSEPP